MLWGVISFHNLPVDAYPDIANNYVQIITQWPGRAAEEVEQQVTIPIEMVVNGIPHLEHLRSTSMFGMSSLMLIFDDDSDNNWNRQKVQERLNQAELPGRPEARDRHRFQPQRRDLLVHAQEHEPAIRPDGTEVARGLGARKAAPVGARRGRRVRAWAALPGNTRCASIPISSCPTASASARLKQQLSGNNVNGGGSFVEVGLQQVHVRSVGLIRECERHPQDRHQDPERNAAAHRRYRRGRAGRQDQAGAGRQSDPPRRTARSSIMTTSWRERSSCARARTPSPR